MLFAGCDSRPIMLTSSCNVDPITPNFYIVKVGFTGVYIFLRFALKHRLRELRTEKLQYITYACYRNLRLICGKPRE